MSGNGRIKVLYIAGWGRNGSTVISNILGQIPGFFSVGEARYLWQMGLVDNGDCGCGQKIPQCNVWLEIIRQSFGAESKVDYQQIADLCYAETRHKNFLGMVFSVRTHLFPSHLKRWLKILENLYRSIYHQTGGAIIVDSSKSPIYAAALSLIPSLEVYVVHLVRDPRAVAFSWAKPKGNLHVHSPSFTSLAWSFWNFTIEHLKSFAGLNYYLLRYEDFATNPRASICSLVEYVHGVSEQLPFLDDHTVVLKATHSVAGNPNRFELGEVAIKTDVRWIQNMSALEKFIVSLLTLPFLRKYGYPLFK